MHCAHASCAAICAPSQTSRIFGRWTTDSAKVSWHELARPQVGIAGWTSCRQALYGGYGYGRRCWRWLAHYLPPIRTHAHAMKHPLPLISACKHLHADLPTHTLTAHTHQPTHSTAHTYKPTRMHACPSTSAHKHSHAHLLMHMITRAHQTTFAGTWV